MLEVYDYIRENCSLVGVSGAAGSGKDHVARTHFVEGRGYKNISFAWHFKIEAIAKGSAEYDEVFVTKPPRVRRLLQLIGTEQGRNLWGDDVWIDTAFCWIKLWHEQWGMNKFIVPDVRFPNEASSIQKVGGSVFRVVSNQAHNNLIERDMVHASETSLSDDDPIFDGIIMNDRYEDGTWYDSSSTIKVLMNEI